MRRFIIDPSERISTYLCQRLRIWRTKVWTCSPCLDDHLVFSRVEVSAYREELDGIKVVGKRCPHPIKTWSQCITSDKLLTALRKCGEFLEFFPPDTFLLPSRYNYEKPTPIQAQALPIIHSGRNMIGIAKTGSGKTLAFLLPMFRHIRDQPPLEGDDGPIGKWSIASFC